MGNTDSQYSSFSVPGKPRPCSLKFHSAKEEALSAHSWWRASEGGGQGHGTGGTAGRGCQHQASQDRPYCPWTRHGHPVTGGARVLHGSPGTKLKPSSPKCCDRGDGSQVTRGKVCDGGFACLEGSGESAGGQRAHHRNLLCESIKGGSSPKVVLSKDGSMRVEFTNAKGRSQEPEGLSGHPGASAEPPVTRARKGSSLSSEGSWYDCPWGGAAELSDNVFACSQAGTGDNSSGYTTYSSTRTEETGCGYGSSGYNTFSSARTEDISPEFSGGHLFQTAESNGRDTHLGFNGSGYNTCSSGRTEDSGIGDSMILHPDQSHFHPDQSHFHPDQSHFPLTPHPVSLSDLCCSSNSSVAATFPTGQFRDIPKHRSSLASVLTLDAVIQEEGSGLDDQRYPSPHSHTLPCRRAATGLGAPAVGNSRKDNLKSRIRRLGDWTGSLSRKKRRLQEPCGSEASEGFGGGLDPGTGPSSSQSTCSLWNTLYSHTYSQTTSVHSGASRGLQSHSDSLRQNIYENFMQELETDGCSGPERPEPSEEGEDMGVEGEDVGGEGELGGSHGSGSQGSLEQLDLLFEMEQGVVRRAGWLSFKPLLTVHKDRRLELVARRKWRQYWVTLKGCTLLLYETYGKGSCPEQEMSPRYALLAKDSIVQAIPEHPKKENVFCLSNAYGDVYLLQAGSQTDLENWVTAIHSASASLLAKRQGKEDTVRLLRSQTRALLQKIDMDGKMKKMAELQLSVVSDQRNRKAIESQIQQWEQNLEKFNVDLFRMRCYLASLQGTELPNPKSLLAVAGRPSKSTLGRLGIFSVSSFHALICTRDEAALRRHCRSFSMGTRSKRGLFSSLKGLDSLTKRSKEKGQSVSQVCEGLGLGVPAGPIPNHCSSERLDTLAKMKLTAPPEGHPWYSSWERPICVTMPDSQSVALHIKHDSLVSDVLSLACKERHLEPSQHCLHVRRLVGQITEVSAPGPTHFLRDLAFDELEVLPLNAFAIHLSRPSPAVDFGFAVTGHVDGAGTSHVFVSEVNPEGLAFSEGLRAGDEITVLNGTGVSSLDLGLMHTLFNHQTLRLLLRREVGSSEDHVSAWPDCDPWQPAPPPPSHCSDPRSADVLRPQELPESSVASSFDEVSPRALDDTAQLSQNVETVCSLYQTFPEGYGATGSLTSEGQGNPYSMEPRQKPPCPRHMSISERLCKVIQELVDTERSYVKDLGCLFDIYLMPLQSETFLSHDEMESLFGSLPEMLDFQRVFLHTLEERIASSPNLISLETPEQFKQLLSSLCGSFLYYADHFKLYSGFCANHIKVQKVLERAKTDRAFKEFLEARNPTKQHSSTLESYLIKPVQRVLKYPLLLRELVSLTDSESEEHSHLTEALRAMEKVASHINEMQKIYEDYGTVFDQLVAEQSSPEKEVTEISMGEFLVHSSLKWLNPPSTLGRMRKDPELTLFVFKRAVILVCRDSGKMKKRMTTTRSGDLDPFKFRWLIPVSAVQVRLGNTTGTENPCIWELVHTKSQVEGRPERVFQLCSSDLENKASVVKALRSLRDCTRRPLLSEGDPREHLGSLRRTQQAAANVGSCRRQQRHQVPGRTAGQQNCSNDANLCSGGLNPAPGDTCSEPQLPNRSTTGIPGLEGAALGKRARLCSLTSALEAQLQRLNFTEEAGPRGIGTQQEPLRQGVQSHWSHPDAQGRANGLQGSQRAQSPGALDNDSQCMDLNTLLGRDFSVQSLTSVVNEDCFYDAVMGIQKAAIPTL
ncbi:T-lymphoma invasion and metastasis-inducing protein 2 [Esox lucius]|uniref:TIAM Rac1 associated GEF 2a n=1 Tax=Esox lucius TaxID=8010 RepID=A0A3P9A4J1_ESOLU|nr:T-lymphoma invasion and metastasis-inducing protein 2 [Esox lucius]XP_010881031.2 T-lymphoma invasion and metastasis-inducing protein 2 [Esox lucius]XP_019912000.2 T-lymphoma invasion and metastasis-inducing protein 2 [Esox lucius]